MKLLSSSCAAAAALFLALPSHAHVTLEYQVAPADAPYKATFRVGHGCGDSPTRQLSVVIPAGVTGAKPMPKPGWTLAVQRGERAQPQGPHGGAVTEDVVRVTWTARTAGDMLPNEHYDEFVLVARTPAQPGTIHWPVHQVCENGRTDWVEVPREGRAPTDLKAPAAALEILPAASHGGHRH